MATSPFFRHNVQSEQDLYEDLIVESMKFYGVDIYYLPREVVHSDMIFNDEVLSRFKYSYVVEVYIDNVDGFDGDGNLFQKFGVEIRDAVTLTMSRRRWNTEIRKHALADEDGLKEITADKKYYRPREGDLIHLPMSNQTFEVQSVVDENPFYQLGQLATFKLRCELFEFGNEVFDTMVPEIDRVEEFAAYQWELGVDSSSNGFLRGEIVTQSHMMYDVTGEVVHWSDSDNIIRLANVGNTTGEYRPFERNVAITGATLNSTVHPLLVSELQNVQPGSPGGSNPTAPDDFDISAFEFVDFNESNPFGDII
jgi:hypothetical protein